MNDHLTLQTRSDSYLDALKSILDERISSLVSETEPDQLRSALQHAVEGGKRIRPLITMLACAAAGGDESDALDAGVAVELLHTASLVHDDIMDRSELRRGRPAIHACYDLPTAILVGDTLTALAFRSLHRCASPRQDRVRRIFSDAFVRLCEGQSEDLVLSREEGVDHGVHRAMVEKKTAQLLEVAAGMGALIGAQEEYPVHCLSCFGLNIGLAFQAMDDLLDSIGDESVAGKTLRVDLKNGRKTFVTIPHHATGTAAGVMDIVAEHTRSACEALEGLSSSPARECLLTLAQSLMRRRA